MWPSACPVPPRGVWGHDSVRPAHLAVPGEPVGSAGPALSPRSPRASTAPCCRAPGRTVRSQHYLLNDGDFYEPCLAPCLCHSSVPCSPWQEGTRGGGRGRRSRGRVWTSGHSARVLIHKMGALAIFNGDARGPDDYSVGFNPHLPTSGQVGNVQPCVRDPGACGESQSQPEQPQRRGPGLLKLSRV